MNNPALDLDALERIARAATPGERDANETNMGWRISTEPGFAVVLYYRHDTSFERSQAQAAADAAFLAKMDTQTVLELIRMARTGYQRALRDVREGQRVAQVAGVPVACGFGCEPGRPKPGCVIHDPTAPIPSDGTVMGSGT